MLASMEHVYLTGYIRVTTYPTTAKTLRPLLAPFQDPEFKSSSFVDLNMFYK
jgi:hypothetical protein